jgi:two-component system phosphate regulon sensor histidine kinase PhoR
METPIEILTPLLALAVALLLILLLWRSARIRKVRRTLERASQGDPGTRTRERFPDEVGRLGRAANRLLHEHQEQLVAVERDRDERDLILETITDGVALIDGEDRLLFANRSLGVVLGTSVAPVPGTRLGDLITATELARVIAEARYSDLPVELDLRLAEEEPRFLSITATRFTPAGENAALLVFRDVSETERQTRVRQDFVANVSHELKTPLTSLRGYAETLLEGGLEDVENRSRFVLTIREQAIRLESLVEDLLSLAELERSGAELHLQRYDLRDAVERQVAAFRRMADRAGLVLEVIPGPPVEITADRARIDQVLANLLENAIKYTEEGGVHVSLGKTDSGTWCEVADTGVGIPEEHKPRIFERFYRVDKARSREKGGTGLGLSIVKHAVVLHGGDITFRSTPGKGSAFRFEIPRISNG